MKKSVSQWESVWAEQMLQGERCDTISNPSLATFFCCILFPSHAYIHSLLTPQSHNFTTVIHSHAQTLKIPFITSVRVSAIINKSCVINPSVNLSLQMSTFLLKHINSIRRCVSFLSLPAYKLSRTLNIPSATSVHILTEIMLLISTFWDSILTTNDFTCLQIHKSSAFIIYGFHNVSTLTHLLSLLRPSNATWYANPTAVWHSLVSGRTATWRERWATWRASPAACLRWALMVHPTTRPGTTCSWEPRSLTPATSPTTGQVRVTNTHSRTCVVSISSLAGQHNKELFLE